MSKRSWTAVSPTQWVLTNEDGHILAAVNKHGPYLGNPDVVFRTSGQLIDQVMDFGSLTEAQEAVERARDEADKG